MSDYSSENYSSGASGFASDTLSGLMEPDLVLPSQFFEKRGCELLGGERRLMAALLSDGIESFITQSIAVSSGKSKKTDALEWVETKDYSYVFSFDLVCESLGLDPDYLRLGLSRYIASVNEQRKAGNTPKTIWKKIRRPRKHH